MALSEVIARLGFQLDDRALKKGEKSVGSFTSKLQQMGQLIAGSLIVRGAVRFVDDLTKEADALAKTSRQLGLNTDELQRYQIAAQFAGVENEKFNQSLRVLSKNALLASEGSKQTADGFKKLGVDILDANGQLKNGNQLMRETGLALDAMENSTEKVALAQILMGRTGAALLPLFEGGEEGLKKQLAALEEFGGGLSSELIPLAEETRDNLVKWGIATDALKSKLAVAFLPALNQVIITISRWLAIIGKATEGTTLWSSVMITLAAISFKALITGLLSLAKILAIPLLKFVLLVLIIDDLTTFFAGGDSLIGRGLDKLFGKGTQDTVRKGLASIGAALKALAKDPSWNTVDNFLDRIFGGAGQALVESFVIVFGRAVLDDILGVLNTMAGALERTFDKTVKAFETFGPDIIDGLVKGIKTGISRATGVMGELAGAMITAFKDRFKSKSASKVMVDEGLNIDSGLVQGLLRGRHNVQAAMNGLVPAPVNRSASIRINQVNNTNVQGGATPVQTGRAVGRSVASSTRSVLDDAAVSLIPSF